MTDTELIDAMADLRIVDGIGGVDIDEETSHEMAERELDDTEENWRIVWRRQFRLAVQKWIESEREAA